jgi:hypothetical protein
METLGYILAITPSSVLPVPLLLELITNIWTNHHHLGGQYQE